MLFCLFVVISEKVVGDCFVSSHNSSVMSSVMSYKDPLDYLLCKKFLILCKNEEKQVSKRSANWPCRNWMLSCKHVFLVFENMAADHMQKLGKAAEPRWVGSNTFSFAESLYAWVMCISYYISNVANRNPLAEIIWRTNRPYHGFDRHFNG